MDYFWRSGFIIKLKKPKITWKKEKVSVSEKKVSAPIPMPKLNFGFGSQFQNLVLVVHYFLASAWRLPYDLEKWYSTYLNF